MAISYARLAFIIKRTILFYGLDFVTPLLAASSGRPLLPALTNFLPVPCMPDLRGVMNLMHFEMVK